jgi:hypothetical protein
LGWDLQDSWFGPFSEAANLLLRSAFLSRI